MGYYVGSYFTDGTATWRCSFFGCIRNTVRFPRLLSVRYIYIEDIYEFRERLGGIGENRVSPVLQSPSNIYDSHCYHFPYTGCYNVREYYCQETWLFGKDSRNFRFL